MNNNVVVLLTSYIVNAVWQIPVLAFAAWSLSRLVERAGPELPHRIWVATLILATLVPATPLIRSQFVHPELMSQGSASLPDAARGSARNIPLTGSDMVFQSAALYLVSGLYLAAAS